MVVRIGGIRTLTILGLRKRPHESCISHKPRVTEKAAPPLSFWWVILSFNFKPMRTVAERKDCPKGRALGNKKVNQQKLGSRVEIKNLAKSISF